MALTVYLLCALTSAVCALLLARGFQASRTPFLFWGALCFFVMGLANALLFFDLVVYPQVDLSVWRSALNLAALGSLLYGLIFETSS
jgi:cytochrome bd-type quinol oxidase subunit 2